MALSKISFILSTEYFCQSSQLDKAAPCACNRARKQFFAPKCLLQTFARRADFYGQNVNDHTGKDIRACLINLWRVR